MKANIPVSLQLTRQAVEMRRRSLPKSAFSLVEVLVTVALSVISLSTFYTSAGQAIRIVRSGKDTANASQLLQQRIEAFRSAPQWAKVTTPSGIVALITPTADSAANLTGVTETVTVNSYPTPGTPIVVVRTANGGITSSGPSLSTQKCVKLTIQVTGTGLGRTKTRQLSTIVTKGGV